MRTIFLILLSAAAGFALARMTRRREEDSSAPLISISFAASSGESFTVKGELSLMMEMKEGQVSTARVTPRTKRGKTARIDEASAQWESSDESVARVEPSAESPLVARIFAEGEGEALIIFRADADPGEAVREIIGTTSVVVKGGDAVIFDLSVSEPMDAEEAEAQGGTVAATGGDGGAPSDLSGGGAMQGGGEPLGGESPSGAPPTGVPTSGIPEGSSATGGGVEQSEE